MHARPAREVAAQLRIERLEGDGRCGRRGGVADRHGGVLELDEVVSSQREQREDFRDRAGARASVLV